MAVIVNVAGKWDGRDIEKARKQLAALGNDAEKSGKKTGGAFGSIGDSIKPLLAIGAGAATITFLKNAVQSAGELQDTVSAAGQVFGQSQGKIVAFAKGAATSMGLSENAALKAATSFAVFGKSAGLSGDAAAGFSTTLTQLAGDMASFYGGSVEDAVQAIGSALRGEMEPIRRYNVLLDDATLRQEALAMGLIKTTNEALTPQQKVLAANAAILKQTTLVQGDYNRTADQFSNVQRTFQAELENTTTAIGSSLLPAATSLMSAGRGMLGVFNDIPAPVKVAAAAMVAGAVASRLLGDQLQAMNGFGKNTIGFFRSLGDTWRYVGVQAAASGQASVGATTKLRAMFDTMRTGQAATGMLKSAGAGLMSMLGGPWGLAIGGATLAVTAYMNAQQNAQQAVDALSGAIDAQSGSFTASGLEQIAQALHSDLNNEDVDRLKRIGVNFGEITRAIAEGGPAYDAARAKLDGLLKSQNGYGQEAGATRTAIRGLISSMGNQNEVVYDARMQWESHKDALAAAKDAEVSVKPPIDAATRAADLQRQGLEKLTGAFKAWAGLIDKSAALDNYRTSLHNLGSAIETNGTKFKGTSAAAIANRDALRGALSSLADYADKQSTAAGKARVLQDGLGQVRERLRKLKIPESEINAMLRPYDKLASGAKQAGRDIATGVAIGIIDKRAQAIAQAQALGKAAVQAVRRGAEVMSPSKYTMWVGSQIVKGLTKGVIDNAGGAKKVIKDATAAALEGAREAVEKFKAKGREILDFIKGIKDQVKGFGSVAGFQGEEGKSATATDVIGQMKAKVEKAKQFAKDIEGLRKLGLNNSSIQEIIQAGPDAGGQIAAALLEGGKSAVSEVNSLESQLNTAAAAIGDTAGLSQYGYTAQQAKALTQTNVKVEKGAIVLTVGAGAKASDAKAIKNAVDDAIDKAIAKMIRELKAAK